MSFKEFFKKSSDFEFDKDKKSSLQTKAVKGLAAFLIIMFLLTVISRAADSVTIAKITVVDASSMSIAHNIEADGTISSNKDIAISTAPGVKIESVEVQEGQLVKKDDLLIQLDMDDLQKNLIEKQKELRVIEATASDKAANEAIAAAEERKARDRAYEDYDDTMREASDAVSDAKKAMKDALKAYNDAKKESGEAEIDTSVRDQLEKTKTEKSTVVDQAQKDLDEIKAYIEEQKENLSSEKVDEYVKAETDKLIDEETDKRYKEYQENQKKSAETAAETADETSTETSGETAETEAQLTWDEIREMVVAECQTEYEEKVRQDKKIDIEMIVTECEDTVDQQYAKKLEDAQKALETAQSELTDAENAISTYDDEQAAAAANSKDARLQELYNAYLEKQAAYEEAVDAYNATKKTAKRSLQDLNTTTETVDTVTDLTKDDEKNLKELEVKALQEVYDAEGKITAPSDGLVTKVAVTTGEATSEDTVVRISDQSAGYRFTAALDKDDAKYLKAGDKISLEIGNDVTVDNLPITKMEMSTEDKNSYSVIADIPSKVNKISNFATMRVTRESERYYTCVPLNVLHSDGSNYYVYVVTTKDSVLGTENTVKKVDVTILDKNNEYAAIDGFFDWDQQFVLSSNKTLTDGDRVRIQGSSDSRGGNE